MTEPCDKLFVHERADVSVPSSAAPLADKAESADIRRTVFWKDALASSSILLWIVTNLAGPECPLL